MTLADEDAHSKVVDVETMESFRQLFWLSDSRHLGNSIFTVLRSMFWSIVGVIQFLADTLIKALLPFLQYFKIICIVLGIVLQQQHKLLYIYILWKQTPRKRNKQTANRGQILPPCLFYFPSSNFIFSQVFHLAELSLLSPMYFKS